MNTCQNINAISFAPEYENVFDRNISRFDATKLRELWTEQLLHEQQNLLKAAESKHPLAKAMLHQNFFAN